MMVCLHSISPNVINSIKLRNKTFPINLIQGPLAGISCAPFRFLTWKYSKPAYSCTEMISCKTLIHQPKKVYQRYIEKNCNEGPVCFQLSSNDPLELAVATKKSTELGADLIDLNCGCPVKKIRNKGTGSRLLADPRKLYELIYAMKKNTHLPVSVKIRVAGRFFDQSNQDIAQAVCDGGADFIVVHGRHWTENYATPCRYDQIKFFVDALKIPVIGNGDVQCAESLKRMFSIGCAGVMIGRAGVGKPWLIKKLLAELTNQPFIEPTLKEIGEIFLEHTAQLIELLGAEPSGILQARKFAKYYAHSLDEIDLFIKELNLCKDFISLEKVITRFFNR